MGMARRAVGTIAIVLVVGCISATAAQASHLLGATSYPASLSAGQVTTHTFKFEGGSAVAGCGSVGFSGAIYASVTSFELTPSYSECNAIGFVGATVAMNGCRYALEPAFEESGTLFSGYFSILCSAGKKIVITAATCKIELGEQVLEPEVLFQDLEGTVKLTYHVSFLEYTATAGFLCPLTSGTHSDGAYAGSSVLSGSSWIGVS